MFKKRNLSHIDSNLDANNSLLGGSTSAPSGSCVVSDTIQIPDEFKQLSDAEYCLKRIKQFTSNKKAQLNASNRWMWTSNYTEDEKTQRDKLDNDIIILTAQQDKVQKIIDKWSELIARFEAHITNITNIFNLNKSTESKLINILNTNKNKFINEIGPFVDWLVSLYNSREINKSDNQKAQEKILELLDDYDTYSEIFVDSLIDIILDYNDILLKHILTSNETQRGGSS